MNYNILIGGAAGQGMNTLSKLLSKSLKRHGYHVFMNTVYMSRIRGGHNYFQIRFSDKPVHTHQHGLDVIIALNQETIDLHEYRLKDGMVLCDQNLTAPSKLGIDVKGMAKSIGHLKGENMILLGAIAKLFGLSPDVFENLINTQMKSGQTLNIEAFKAGFQSLQQEFITSEEQVDQNIIINGNNAIALGALAAGMTVYSAYPMTPATSIMNYLIKHQKSIGHVVEQAEDEIAAIHIALGASAAGARAMTASSGGGISLMVEALGLTAVTETPLVIVDVMRPGPATGLPTKTGQSDLSFVLTASQDEFPRMIIAVKDPRDAFYQTIRAFDLSEKYQIPVIILSDQYLADSEKTIERLDFNHTIHRYLASNEAVDVPYQRYKFTDNGVSPRLLPGLSDQPVIADNHEHDPYGKISEDPDNRTQMHLKRLKKLKSLELDLQEPEYFGPENATTVLVGFGSVKGALQEVAHKLKVGALVFGDLFPLPTQKLKALSSRELINVELNATGQLARLIRMETGITFDDSILKFDGRQINAEDIQEVLNERL